MSIKKITILSLLSFCILLNASKYQELDKNGTLSIKGKKVFIYGTYHHLNDNWQDFTGLKQAGFNLVHTYHFENWNKSLEDYLYDAKKYLDLAHKAGMGVFLGLPRNMVKQGDVKSIKTIVNALKNKPALWFWYLYDEPAQAGLNPKTCLEIFRAIKSIDKQRPIVITDNCKFDSQVYAACDMIWTDRYPAPFGILPVWEVQKEAGALWPNRKIWSVPHVHSDLEMSKGYHSLGLYNDAEHLHRPNAKEIKAMLHCGLAGGARGEILYQYCNTKMQQRRPKAWQAIVETGKLFKQLNDILVASEPKTPVMIKVKDWKTRYEALARPYPNYRGSYPKLLKKPEVVAWQREYNGELYIGLVNAGYQPRVKVDLSVPYKFKSVIQYPQKKTVVTVDKMEKWKADQRKIPVAVLSIVKGQKLELQMNECDVIVWRFVPADK